MIIDCHGHYTTAPRDHHAWRDRQIAAWKDGVSPPAYPSLSDETLRESVAYSQIRLQRERGTDLTLLSPQASAMNHASGDAGTNLRWAMACNDLMFRLCGLYPERFVGVAQLPQALGVDLKDCVQELERCVTTLGFVGCNLNPDPSDGHWAGPPLGDRYWYPLYEKMVDLDVPAMIHGSRSCNCAVETAGAHYINVDTTAWVQLTDSDVFSDFPTLRFILPHGGGAVPYQWGRYRGLAQLLRRPDPIERLGHNIFFDTCVYHQAGIDLLTRVVPATNILFAAELLGAAPGIDPQTGFPFDDTRRYIEAVSWLTEADRESIFHGNAYRVFGRLAGQIAQQKMQGHSALR